MNGRRVTDDQVSRALRAHLPERAAAGLRERVFATAESTAQQRPLPSFLGAFSEADPVSRRRSLLIAAALLVALAFASAAAIGALRLQIVESIQIEPTSTRLPTSTPTLSERPSPSGPAGPLAWSEASLKEDWPAPVRPEPAGGAIVLPFGFPEPPDRMPARDTYPDPSGDTGLPVLPWVDIRELSVGLGGRVTIGLANNVPPAVDPTDQWIAYGVVIDADRDGVPDWRYGIDNMPVDATGERPHRAWITDLHTGRTESNAGGPNGFVGKTFFDTSYPGEPPGQMTILEFGGGDVVGGGSRPGQVHPFYAWASVIQDGRVVATDYAPDVGWLDPAPKANP